MPIHPLLCCRPPACLQAYFVRLQVEPEAAALIKDTVVQYGGTGSELVAAADLDGFTMGHPVAEVVARLVLATE